MKPAEELTEGIDGIMFGNIFHRAVVLLYQNYADKLITENTVNDLKTDEKLDKSLTFAFNEIVSNGKPNVNLTGLYLVNYQILKKYLKRLLEFDKQRTPFIVRGLEMPVIYTVNTELDGKNCEININGYIDRYIEKDGKNIVQDFKTGNVETDVANIEELFSESKKKSFSAMRQAIIYSLSFPDNKEFKPEIISVRKPLSDENVTLFINNIEIETVLKLKNEFNAEIKKLINRIFSKNEPFVQTQNEKFCEYCDYKQICRR